MASAAPPTIKWTSAIQDCGLRGDAFHFLSMVRQSDTFFSLPFHPSKTGRRWCHESYRRIQRTRHAGEADGNRVQHLPGALHDAEIADARARGRGRRCRTPEGRVLKRKAARRPSPTTFTPLTSSGRHVPGDCPPAVTTSPGTSARSPLLLLLNPKWSPPRRPRPPHRQRKV